MPEHEHSGPRADDDAREERERAEAPKDDLRDLDITDESGEMVKGGIPKIPDST